MIPRRTPRAAGARAVRVEVVTADFGDRVADRVTAEQLRPRLSAVLSGLPWQDRELLLPVAWPASELAGTLAPGSSCLVCGLGQQPTQVPAISNSSSTASRGRSVTDGA
jgi:hypothetical protein